MSRADNRIVTTANREQDIRDINARLKARNLSELVARFDTEPYKGYVMTMPPEWGSRIHRLGTNLAEALATVDDF